MNEDRRKAIIKMAWIMFVFQDILIAGILIEWLYFDSKHGFYFLAAIFAYIGVFGRYIGRMNERINEKYPKGDGSENSN